MVFREVSLNWESQVVSGAFREASEHLATIEVGTCEVEAYSQVSLPPLSWPFQDSVSPDGGKFPTLLEHASRSNDPFSIGKIEVE